MRTDAEPPPPPGDRRPLAERTATTSRHVATLLPTQGPGRLTRKARHYVAQIIGLRDQGYTLEAIQQALAAVGVQVSISTVRREAMRPLPLTSWPVAGPGGAPSAVPVAHAHPPAAAAVSNAESSKTAGVPASSNGKDFAAAYAHSKSTNALTRAKERS